jgi:rare lipoprotein A
MFNEDGMPSFRGKRAIRVVALTAAALALAGCASSDKFARKVDPKYGVASSPRVVELGERVPKGGGVYRVGKPYVVAGRTFVPEENTSYRSEGLASWYGRDFHGRQTANVRVTNLSNKRSLIVRVNDRGPFHGNRVIDLSHKTAELLDFKGNGVARVRVEYIGRAAIEGSDDRRLAATLRQGEPAPAPILVASAGNTPIALPQSPRGLSVGGPIPVPAGRPYNLGEPTPRLSDVTAAGRPQRTASRPVSGGGSLRYDARAGFMSGRGLY